MQVSTFGVRVAPSIVLETAADWQLFDFTGEPISNVIVLTAALLLPLTINTFHLSAQMTVNDETRQGKGLVLTGAIIVQVACSWQPPFSFDAQGSMG